MGLCCIGRVLNQVVNRQNYWQIQLGDSDALHQKLLGKMDPYSVFTYGDCFIPDALVSERQELRVDVPRASGSTSSFGVGEMKSI